MVAKPRNSSGFSLVEILIALVLAGLVSTAIYKVYISQNKSYAVQEHITEMHQNLRVAISMMKQEIRMAGYDPARNASAGISSAGADTMQFSMDISGGDTDGIDNDVDGSVDEADEAAFSDGAILADDGENITYVHYDSDSPVDGVNDALVEFDLEADSLENALKGILRHLKSFFRRCLCRKLSGSVGIVFDDVGLLKLSG